MRHLQSDFHFRHALFALQGPDDQDFDGYVDALLACAREHCPIRPAPISFRRLRGRRGASDNARASLRLR